MCIKRVFSAEYCVFAHLTSFLLNNACTHKELLVLVLVSLSLHNLTRLHVSQCFHCVKNNNEHKTCFKREIMRFTQLTSFLLKNALNRKEMLVLPLVRLVLLYTMCLHVFQCSHCVKTDNLPKTRFYRKKNAS